jgi:hypothetical protein
MRSVLVLVILALSSVARAQEPEPPPQKVDIGVSLTIWVPQADADDFSNTSLGIRPQLAFWVQRYLAIVAAFDFVFVDTKQGVGDVTYYSISLGGRLTTPRHARVKPFGELLIGRYKIETDAGDDANLGFRLGGGVMWHAGRNMVGNAGLAFSSASLDPGGFGGNLSIEALIFDIGFSGRF